MVKGKIVSFQQKLASFIHRQLLPTNIRITTRIIPNHNHTSGHGGKIDLARFYIDDHR